MFCFATESNDFAQKAWKSHASWMWNVLTLLDRQILMTRLLNRYCPLFCPRWRSARWKFAQCLVFSLQSLIVACQTWEDVLHYLENSQNLAQKECIDTASDMMFACYDIIAGPDLGTTLIEGYVHGNVPILLGSLKHWLPGNEPPRFHGSFSSKYCSSLSGSIAVIL